MSEERKDLPSFKPSKIKTNSDTTIEVLSSSPLKTGTSEYGNWELWKINVEKLDVENRDKTIEKEYTGECMWFPTDVAKKKLVEFVNGNSNVKIKITKTLDDTQTTPKYLFTYEKAGEGAVKEQDLTDKEALLMTEVRKLVNGGFPGLDIDTFIKFTKEKMYGGNITTERAIELFKTL